MLDSRLCVLIGTIKTFPLFAHVSRAHMYLLEQTVSSGSQEGCGKGQQDEASGLPGAVRQIPDMQSPPRREKLHQPGQCEVRELKRLGDEPARPYRTRHTGKAMMQGSSMTEWEARTGRSQRAGWDSQTDLTSASGDDILVACLPRPHLSPSLMPAIRLRADITGW